MTNGDRERLRLMQAYQRLMEEEMSKEGVYRYSKDFGRMGYLDGVFVARADDVASVVNVEVYMYDVLGKHSEIPVKGSDIELISEERAVIDLVKEYGPFGFCPLGGLLDELYEIEADR